MDVWLTSLQTKRAIVFEVLGSVPRRESFSIRHHMAAVQDAGCDPHPMEVDAICALMVKASQEK